MGFRENRFKTKTYNELTNIVKQIEIAIGKETLIKFGKKKHKQIAKDMNMTQKEFISFYYRWMK